MTPGNKTSVNVTLSKHREQFASFSSAFNIENLTIESDGNGMTIQGSVTMGNNSANVQIGYNAYESKMTGEYSATTGITDKLSVTTHLGVDMYVQNQKKKNTVITGEDVINAAVIAGVIWMLVKIGTVIGTGGTAAPILLLP